MSTAAAAAATTGRAIVNVYDGTRELYSDSPDLLITVRDGNQKTVSREFHRASSVEFTGLPVFHNAGDNYTFIAWANHYKDAGFFPVKIGTDVAPIVDLMLIPEDSAFSFERWERVRSHHAAIAATLAAETPADDSAEARYNDMKDVSGGAVLACVLNIAASMEQILLPRHTALHYLKALNWESSGDHAMARDRVYGWADPALIAQIEQAKLAGRFADAPGTLHPGATRSYKQIDFGEANLQFTFHENDRRDVDGINCVLLECDVDYFRDALAHLLLEVAVNAFGNMTDPRSVYALRWIAGRRAGIPEFNPPYSLQRA